MGYLHSMISRITPQRSTQEWLDLCRDNDIPAARPLDLTRVTEDPYVMDHGVLQRNSHPTEGDYFSALTPLRMSGSPVSLRRHAPILVPTPQRCCPSWGTPTTRSPACPTTQWW